MYYVSSDISIRGVSPDSFRYLSHHGIKGQKWGVRRYQNPDGTLTELGKKRAAKELVAANKKTQKMDSYKVGSNNSKLIADAIEKNRPIYAREKHARKAYEKFESDFKTDKELVKKHLEYAYFWDGVPLDNILTASHMERERGEPLPLGTNIPTYKNFNFDKSLPKMMKDKHCLDAAFDNYCHGRHAIGDKRAEQAHKRYEQLSQRLRDAERESFKANSNLGKSIVGKYQFMVIKSPKSAYSFDATVKRFGSIRLTRKVTKYRDAVGTVINEEIRDKSKKYRGL